MRHLSWTSMLVTAIVLTAGCASTKVTDRQEYEGRKLARPNHILIYNFAASRSDIPVFAEGMTGYAGAEAQQTPEQYVAARNLGDKVAKELVLQVQAMGLPAEQAGMGTPFRVGDIAIVGYFETVDTGSAVERVALGFGAGAASMRTRVEGYLMTPEGPRQLGGGEVDSGDSKGPGIIVPLAVTLATANPIGLAVGGAVKLGGEVSGHDTIKGVAERTAKEVADQLRVAFQRQGWI